MSAVPKIGESGYERREDDAYFTEPWVTRALLEQVTLRYDVWEGACGRGDMAKVIEAADHNVNATDLVDHGYGRSPMDFLRVGWMPGDEAIVTNPPYALALEFIVHALKLTMPDGHGQEGGMVAMLLRNEFDSAATRQHLFNKPPFAKKLVLTRRPRWDWWEVDKPKWSPRHNYAWFIWDWKHEGPATLAYGPKGAPMFAEVT